MPYCVVMVSVGGRSFSQEVLDRISAQVRAEPGISRRQLSLRVCEWMNWHNAAGRAQEMSCRKSLVALHRRGLIELPALKQRYAFQEAKAPVACPPVAQVSCTLAELGEVVLMRVSCNELSRVWRGLLDARTSLGMASSPRRNCAATSCRSARPTAARRRCGCSRGSGRRRSSPRRTSSCTGSAI